MEDKSNEIMRCLNDLKLVATFIDILTREKFKGINREDTYYLMEIFIRSNSHFCGDGTNLRKNLHIIRSEIEQQKSYCYSDERKRNIYNIIHFGINRYLHFNR